MKQAADRGIMSMKQKFGFEYAFAPGEAPDRFYVYVLFRPTGEPLYVGKGSGRRWRDRRRGHNPRLLAIIKRHGELPSVRVRVGLTEAEAFATEIAFIAAIGRGKDGPLVNMTDGGDGAGGAVRTPQHRAAISAAQRGRKKSPAVIAKNIAAQTERMRDPDKRAALSRANKGKKQSEEARAKMRGRKPSEEARAKMRARRGEKHPLFGRHLTDDQKNVIRLAHLGKKASPETRAKMSVAHKGRKHTAEARAKMSTAASGKNHAMYGKHHTEEAKAKQSAATKGVPMSAETRARMSAAQLRRHAEARAARLSNAA